MSSKIFDNEAIFFINTFEKISGAKIKDFIRYEDVLVFVLLPGNLLKIIGNDAAGLRKVKNAFTGRFEIVEYSDDMEKFVKNLCHRYTLNNIIVSGNKITLSTTPQHKPKLIGKKASNLAWMEFMLGRYFGSYKIYVD